MGRPADRPERKQNMFDIRGLKKSEFPPLYELEEQCGSLPYPYEITRR